MDKKYKRPKETNGWLILLVVIGVIVGFGAVAYLYEVIIQAIFSDAVAAITFLAILGYVIYRMTK